MEKAEIKRNLLQVCRGRLLETIANLEAAMADAQQQANEYGAPKDRYDSFRTQLMRRRDMMAQQLTKELSELKALEMIDPDRKIDSVGFGAVVITQTHSYFISIGLGKVELASRPYYAISPVVPLSHELTGKKKGDRILFRGQEIVIQDIF